MTANENVRRYLQARKGSTYGDLVTSAGFGDDAAQLTVTDLEALIAVPPLNELAYRILVAYDGGDNLTESLDTIATWALEYDMEACVPDLVRLVTPEITEADVITRFNAGLSTYPGRIMHDRILTHVEPVSKADRVPLAVALANEALSLVVMYRDNYDIPLELETEMRALVARAIEAYK